MKFTSFSPAVDSQIRVYLETAVKVILKELPQVKSIILGGGFGRGEGSVALEKGRAIPQNDFEFFLITEKPLKEDLVNQVANKALAKLEIGPTGADFSYFKRDAFANTFYIDMKAIPISKLSQLLPMFRYYELKNSSQLLWGQDYRHLIPDFKVEDFPKTEGLRLLLNRMALLCLYFSFDYSRKMTFSQKHGLMYLGSKAIIDLGGALTQLNGTYQPTYLGRAKVLKKTFKKDFPGLAKKFPEIPDIVKEGTNFKLHPDFKKKINPYKLWCHQKKYIREVLIYFCSRSFNQKFQNVFEVADFLYESGHHYYYHPYLNYLFGQKTGLKLKSSFSALPLLPTLNLLYFLRLLKHQKKFYLPILANKRAPDLTMFAAMIYLLYANRGPMEIDSSKLAKAEYYLKKVYPMSRKDINKNPFKRWEQIKDDFGNAFILFCFLKIV